MSSILRLAAQLSLDGTRFKAGLKEADVHAQKFGANLGASLKGQLAAAFGASAVTAMIKTAFQETAALQDLAEQARMTTREVQELSAAAEDSGLKFTDVMSAQKKFSDARRAAAEGDVNLREEFEKFGFTLEDLNDPSKRFVDFLSQAQVAMSNMNVADKNRALAEMTDLLGKSGSRLTGFINALQKQKESGGLKGIVDEETIGLLDTASEKLALIWRWTKKIAVEDITFAKGRAALAGIASVADYMPDSIKKLPGVQSTIDFFGGEKEEFNGEALPIPKKLYEDKAAQKEMDSRREYRQRAENQALKERLALEKDIFDFKLKGMTASEKNAVIESRMKSLLQDIAGQREEFGYDEASNEQKRTAMELLGQMDTKRGGEQSALARVGQWQGINYQNAGESATVKAVKDLLTPTKKTAEFTEKMANAPAKTINAGLR